MLKKSLYPLVIFNSTYILVFGLIALFRGNIEFLFYGSIVVFFFALLIIKQERLELSNQTLWGLSIWGLLHMLGGNIPVNGSVLYNLQLIPVILKFDQFVHLVGFGAVTLAGFELLKPYLKEKIELIDKMGC